MPCTITVLGTGYVGLIQAVGLADFGNRVTAVDIRSDVVERLSAGTPTIFEHDLSEYLSRNLESGRLTFTTDVGRAVAAADVVFVAVGTPEAPDGSADLSQVFAVADQIAAHATGLTVVAIKSTVPVGTNRRFCERLNRASSAQFVVASNPEFLREGRAVQDFFHPDRVVIGFADSDPGLDDAKRLMEEVYRPLYLNSVPFVWTNWETAELIKYASNAFLATKITFINQMANLAEAVGADVTAVARTMGMDGRISPKFLHPGPGYGGSCFPKDTKAVAATGHEFGVEMSLVDAVVHANEEQKLRTARKIATLVDSPGARIGVLGLSFKAETDDVRESPALTIVEYLVDAGYVVRVHDPKANDAFRAVVGERVEYARSAIDCANGADALVILTEWNEYRNLDLPATALVMRGDLIIDTRNLLSPEAVVNAGLRYTGTGRRLAGPAARSIDHGSIQWSSTRN